MPPPIAPRRSAPELAARSAALLLAAAAAAGFIAVYALDADTQWLGAALGLGLALLALGSIVTAKTLVPPGAQGGARPSLDHDRDGPTSQSTCRADEGITARRLLKGAAGVAGLTVVGALFVPLASLRAGPRRAQLRRMAWSRGRRLVDDAGRPLRADDDRPSARSTPAFPEGADRERLDASLIVVRLHEPTSSICRATARGWAPSGILAYSKICTHAGCAVSLYRYAALRRRTCRARACLPLPLLDVRPGHAAAK